MKKKIEILGLPIDNYSVREAILLAEGYLNSTSMNIIETVSMKTLADTESSEAVKEVISLADLTIIGEKEILTAANIMTPQRLKETNEHEFFHEFMKRIVRNHKRLYILAVERTEMDRFQEILDEQYPKRNQVGEAALEECQGDLENIINGVNGEAADVVISLIPSPRQEEFIREYRDKMSAQIWYGLGAYTGERKSFFRKTLQKVFRKHALMKKMGDYQNEKEEER